VIDWTQTYYLGRILVARPSLFCLVRSPCSYGILVLFLVFVYGVPHIPCVATAGCTTLPELQVASNKIHPDHYMNRVYDLVDLLQ
jgi:hypothetical protein